LSAAGSTSPDSVVLTCSGVAPSSLCLFLQGDVDTSAGVPFGDGLRCVDGHVLVLYSKPASGSVSAPLGADTALRARSAALGDVIPPGSTRYYQVEYRDTDPAFCAAPTGAAFNVSNGYSVTWP
jgi:hypothetical protein